MTYAEARAQIPTEAQWSCSFGNPGCPGYVEYWRAADRRRWNICNGTWEINKDDWHVNRIADAPPQYSNY